MPALVARRDAKMARSAHRYVRGSTKRFYDWLASRRGRSAPGGPRIWICGDCHIGNLGPVGSADGRVKIELRDLDQTVIGNPAHDLIRLALSLAMAARGSNLAGIITARMVESMMQGYEHALRAYSSPRTPTPPERSVAVQSLLKKSRKRSWKHLLQERLGQPKPRLPMGRTFWPLMEAESAAVRELLSTEAVRKLVTSLACRDDHAEVELLDAAFWVKGCSSLGGWRCAALVGVSGDAKSDPTTGAVSLLDIKQALPACTPHSRAGIPKHHGERVVTGAGHLSPYLGSRMLSASIQERPVIVRELMPQDLKLELDRVPASEAEVIARHLATIVGEAHARQLTRAEWRAWLAQLQERRSRSIDAPPWLWSATAELVGTHEAAYLEHCRQHAFASRKT
ncbi:MAG TPA: DUF2252 family protein [Candidatus Dormibacteraeota bacterium]|nr:DUF2252 family protein [Candidatus Dormibacteraeota bacterium]